LLEIKAATGKDMAENVVRPAKVIPTGLVPVSYTPLLISLLRLRMDPMKMMEWWMWKQVEKKLIVVLL
jgi:hypothetical protein